MGYAKGKKTGTEARLVLTISMDDVNRFIQDPRHEARASGFVECLALGGRRPGEDGGLNLLVDEGGPRPRLMWYRLWFDDGAGRLLTLLGYKRVTNDPGFDIWADTTTLYTHIFAGHALDAEGVKAEVLASGVLKLPLQDFLKQLTTFRVEG